MRRSALIFVTLFACGAPEDAQVEPRATRRPAAEQGWVAVAGGTFTLGSPKDEHCREADEDQRVLTVDAFELARRETTRGEFAAVMGSDPSFSPDCEDADCPVVSVTWQEAADYCRRAFPDAGRLPSEAEWEVAARAGSNTALYGGDIESCMASDMSTEPIAWYKANSHGTAHVVATREANALGLYDMAGNAAEWVAERYANGDARVVRGGDWYHNAEHARSAARERSEADARRSHIGFRCARTSGQVGARAGLAAGVVVAGIQYSNGSADKVDAGCQAAPYANVCALSLLTKQAVAGGARLVVLPEYALGVAAEAAPEVGDVPYLELADGALPRFSKLARDLAIYLLVDLETRGDDRDTFNSLVAFGPDGSVVARHDKFELFAGEGSTLTAGKDATVFDTPFGKVGLLVCADLYGDSRLHARMVQTLGARLVAVSSWWTAAGAPNWPRHFARDWGVYVITANTSVGAGRGGGFFGPDGKVLTEHTEPKPGIVFGTLPRRTDAD